jgi:glycosyltransferase involved in cell wall biosynthesis
MTGRTKLLVVGDHACRTGFGRVVRSVCDGLAATGRYDIHVRAINYRPEYKGRVAYEVRPATGDHAADPLGIAAYPEHLKAVRPDAVLLVQDLWHLTTYLAQPGAHEVPTAAYFPVDTPCLKWSYALGLGAAAAPAAYTRFGAHEAAAAVRTAVDVVRGGLPDGRAATPATWVSVPKHDTALNLRPDRLARLQNPGAWDVIPHGLDHAQFSRASRRGRRDQRARFGIPDGAFVVLAVGTNQFRKRLDLTVRAFAPLARARPDALLVIHCMGGGDAQGWDLAQLIDYYGLKGRVKLVHRKHPVLSEADLVGLYHTADVQINTAGGEGWGLTSVEGAACGVAQLVPDWAATREIWGGVPGALLPVADWRHEPKQLNTAHAILDVAAAADRLLALAGDAAARAELADACHRTALALPAWPRVADAFDRLVQRALAEPEAEALSLDDVAAARRGECVSEVAGTATAAEWRARRAAAAAA